MKIKKLVGLIVKRRSGVAESYDERKIYGSVYAACYVVLMNEKECERIAGIISRKITALVQDKKHIYSLEIRKEVIQELRKHNSHAAFMYETHKDIS